MILEILWKFGWYRYSGHLAALLAALLADNGCLTGMMNTVPTAASVIWKPDAAVGTVPWIAKAAPVKAAVNKGLVFLNAHHQAVVSWRKWFGSFKYILKLQWTLGY